MGGVRLEGARDLKTILKGLTFTDDGKVVEQIGEQTAAVRARMEKVRRKILVMSGKGGVGKSTITAHLALAMARRRARVGVLDVDLNGPCIPRLLGMAGLKFTFDDRDVIPVVSPEGIKVASMEFLLDPGAPAKWKGPMELSPIWLGTLEMTVLREMLSDVQWGELDWWFADLPPGAAADKPPALAGLIPGIDGAVIVTTPSALALDVVRRSVAYARDAGIRPLGLIMNMSARLCSKCGHEEPVFGLDTASLEVDFASELELPILGRIPFDHTLSAAAASVADGYRARFDEISQRLVTLVEREEESR